MKRIFLAHLHLKKERERKKRIFSSRFKSLTSIVKLVLIASIDPRCIIYLAMKFYSWDVGIIQYRFQHFANYNPKRRTNSFRIELRSIWLRFLPNQYFINANVSFQNFEKSLGHDRSNRYDGCVPILTVRKTRKFEKHWVETHPSVRDRPRVFVKRARKSRNDICGT